MEGTYKAAIDPVPEASEIGMDPGVQAGPECSTAGRWYEYGQPGHRNRPRYSTVSEPSILSATSTTSSTWSTGSFHSVSELSTDPLSASVVQRPRKAIVIRRRRGHESKRTTGRVVAAIKNEETIGPQKDDAMRDVQRVGTESLSVHPSQDGTRLPSESEMRDDLDAPEELQAAPFPGHELQIALASVQNPSPEPDIFDLSTTDDTFPRHALGRHIYDFTEMNDALPSTPFLSSSRRTFGPYGLTSGSRTQAKVRQIRGESRD